MEDIKWFIKKFGIIFVILLVMIVSVGIFFEKNVRKSSAEETWEKPVQISDIEFWQEESDYEGKMKIIRRIGLFLSQKVYCLKKRAKISKMKH